MQYCVRTVLATMCYYDAMDYPLTAFEVWKYFAHEDIARILPQYHKPRTIGEIVDALEILVRDQRLVEYDGFYILPGRQRLVRVRKARNLLSVRKLRRMQQMMRILRYIPFVRQIWVTGRLAMKHAQNGSDLDLLIALDKAHIWTGRFIVTLIVHILGWRRYGRYTRNRLCLNYFITTDSLAISLDDRFSAHEYMMARCLFTSINPAHFLTANQWITRFRPHFDAFLTLPSSYRTLDSHWAHGVRRLGEWLFSAEYIAQFLRHIQRAKIMRNPNTFKKGSMIVANDNELIFLPNPHSPQIMRRYREICRVQGLAT